MKLFSENDDQIILKGTMMLNHSLRMMLKSFKENKHKIIFRE